ncbi:MAG: DUF1566 domain-containing protein [Myxococcaceae bacterium]|nr:DUF1566 domain-containing protein [Myxococcaceae bacterium]
MLQNSFSEFLSQQFSNLTQLKNQTSSLSKELVTQNAMRGLWAFIGPHLEALPGYKKPFSSNCSVFFDVEIDQVVCDAQFEEVQEISTSCKAEQPFPVGYLTQLHKSNILQTRIVVGLAPVQHPQIMYWLYGKLPSTPTGSLTQTYTENMSPTDSLSDTSASKSGSHSASNPMSDTAVQSLTQSLTFGAISQSLSQSPSSASMCSSIDPYADATNQTGRYWVSGDISDSTVTDLWTGLMWEQTGSATPLTWNTSALPGSAQAYCGNLSKGGYTDWRLPSVLELQSLVDYAKSSTPPTIDTAAFPNTSATYYYTSLTVAGTFMPWYVGFGASYLGGLICGPGVGNCGSLPNDMHTRCVRSTNFSLVTRYTDELGNTLSDNSTQVKAQTTDLIWQRTQAPLTYNWSTVSRPGSAQEYCNTLTLGGQIWRLPTIKELNTLIDYAISYPGPTTNIAAFPSTPQSIFWSSPSSMLSHMAAWGINFNSGGASYAPLEDSFYVRCVRDPQWSIRAYEDTTNQANRYYVVGNGSEAIVKDTYTNLMWEQQVIPQGMTWNDAASYCAELVKQSYGCWRLPSPQELQSLVDYTVQSPAAAINAVAFPNTTDYYFWTSSIFQANKTLVWDVRFNNSGLVYPDGTTKSTAFSLRCVRGTPLSLETRFTDENHQPLTGDSVQVKDLTTGLIWQRIVSYSTWGLFGEALVYCPNLKLGGVLWRIPTAKELLTLVDYTQYNPSIDSSVFPGPTSNWFYSNTWYVSFIYGEVGYLDLPYTPPAIRCVRDYTMVDSYSIQPRSQALQ